MDIEGHSNDVPLVSREYTPLLRKSASLLPPPNEDREEKEHVLPEITARGVVLSLVLSFVFSSANAYLGLLAGMTIGVSIPSAVMTMAFIYPFGGNILEVNAIQSGAAPGSSLAAGIIFTIPALIILDIWDNIRYLETTAIAILGGVVGVMFSSPLRRAFVVQNTNGIKFPEGFAAAEILKLMEITDDRTTQVILIGCGALVGFIVKLGQSGLILWSPDFQAETAVNGRYLLYFGLNLSPALMSVGYIVGLATASVIFMGGAINWWIVIPILYATGSEENSAFEIWDTKSRFIGVGAMLIGSLGTIISLLPSLYLGLKSAMHAYRRVKAAGVQTVPRTERDLSIRKIALSFLVIIPALFALFLTFTGSQYYWVALLMTVFMTICGFLFTAGGAYMSGVVGSSNNPISGMTLAAIVTSAGLIMLVMSNFKDEREQIGCAVSILIGAVVCCAAAVSGDSMQDLKTGHILGATPLKQQTMQLLGVIFPGFLIAPIVDLLIRAYGLSTNCHPRKSPLQVPQATLMAKVATSVFSGGELHLELMCIGMGIAALIFVVDLALRSRSKYRLPVLAAALGMYLPFSLSSPIIIGGFVVILANFVLARLDITGSEKEACLRKGLLFAAGLITGEALVGILLAIPIVFTGNFSFMAIFGNYSTVQWPGILMLIISTLCLFASVVGQSIHENYHSLL